MPGSIFRSEDRPFFDELSQVVVESRLSSQEAEALSRAIQSALRSSTPGDLLRELTERLPGLVPMQIAAGGNEVAQRSTLTALRAIFDGTASARPKLRRLADQT